MSIYIAAILSLAGLAAWVLWVRQPADAPRDKQMGLGLALPATAWLVALLAPQPSSLYNKGAITLGLLLALLALAIWLSKFLPVYLTHAFLLLVYALYGTAFAARTAGLPTPWAIIVVLATLGVFIWLWPNMAELRESLAIYGLVIFLALWQALELATQQPTHPAAWAALAGMLLVCVGLLFEAQARFRPLRPSLATLAMPLLALGHLVVAWSVWV